jgi:hypothetical protein
MSASTASYQSSASSRQGACAPSARLETSGSARIWSRVRAAKCGGNELARGPFTDTHNNGSVGSAIAIQNHEPDDQAA